MTAIAIWFMTIWNHHDSLLWLFWLFKIYLNYADSQFPSLGWIKWINLWRSEPNKHIFPHLKNKICTSEQLCSMIILYYNATFIKKLKLIMIWILHLAILQFPLFCGALQPYFTGHFGNNSLTVHPNTRDDTDMLQNEVHSLTTKTLMSYNWSSSALVSLNIQRNLTTNIKEREREREKASLIIQKTLWTWSKNKRWDWKTVPRPLNKQPLKPCAFSAWGRKHELHRWREGFTWRSEEVPA